MGLYKTQVLWDTWLQEQDTGCLRSGCRCGRELASVGDRTVTPKCLCADLHVGKNNVPKDVCIPIPT